MLNNTPLQSWSLIESSTIDANLLICILQGVTFDQVEAMPTCGIVKSCEVKPTPLSIALEADC